MLSTQKSVTVQMTDGFMCEEVYLIKLAKKVYTIFSDGSLADRYLSREAKLTLIL